ncbi:MAG: hypothetical protein QXR30_04400 [Candidatus Woesearchaeota archaeon]
MKNKILFGILALFVLSALVSVFAVSSFGNPQARRTYYNEEVHAKLQEAIKNRDYENWKKIREEYNLPNKGRIFSVINKENFGKYAELHEAMQNNDLEKANQIKAELGLGMGQMKRGNQGQGKRFRMNQ